MRSFLLIEPCSPASPAPKNRTEQLLQTAVTSTAAAHTTPRSATTAVFWNCVRIPFGARVNLGAALVIWGVEMLSRFTKRAGLRSKIMRVVMNLALAYYKKGDYTTPAAMESRASCPAERPSRCCPPRGYLSRLKQSDDGVSLLTRWRGERKGSRLRLHARGRALIQSGVGRRVSPALRSCRGCQPAPTPICWPEPRCCR